MPISEPYRSSIALWIGTGWWYGTDFLILLILCILIWSIVFFHHFYIRQHFKAL